MPKKASPHSKPNQRPKPSAKSPARPATKAPRTAAGKPAKARTGGARTTGVTSGGARTGRASSRRAESGSTTHAGAKPRAAKPASPAAPRVNPGDALIRRQLRDAVEAAVAKKALDPVLLDLRQRADVCDYLFVCHGTNPPQVQAIADAVEEKLEASGVRPSRREGAREGSWIVLDYLDFMVHVFSAPRRRFYDLERLWRDAPRLSLPASVRGSIELPDGDSSAPSAAR